MKIGQKVYSNLFKNYGNGTIILKIEIFGKEFFKVFFKKTGQIIEIEKENLIIIKEPLDLFKTRSFSSSDRFKLNFMAHQMEVLISSGKAVSPGVFKIKPLPHQLLALDFVIKQFKHRCLLSDEVGLGKTIEAALVMEELKLRNIVKRTLIITPASLTVQWHDELKLKFSEDFIIFDKQNLKLFKQLYGLKTNCWRKYDNIITSIDFLKPKKIHNKLTEEELEKRNQNNQDIFEDCLQANWDMVIIDEAHKLSKYRGGKETARFKVGRRFSESVPVFLLLTATPHRGKPVVFKNLLSLIDPYLFNDLEDVKPENVKKISIRNKKRACLDFNGQKLFKNRITTSYKINWKDGKDDPEKELYNAVVEYVSEYYNYALKENNNIIIFLLMLYERIVSSSSRAIFKSLQKRLKTLNSMLLKSRKNDQSFDEFIDLPSEEQLKYLEKLGFISKNSDYMKREIVIISKCIKLANNATIGRNDAKLRHLIEIINKLKERENDKDIKILIFTEFIETQNYLLESLENIGYKTSFINGTLKLEEKIKQKIRFMDEAQIMVSTDAGCEGINLQFCHVVLNYDLPWNPMKIEQRIGRIDRIGQDKDVIVINFILGDTIEAYVREKLIAKLNIIKEQFGEDKLRDILSTLDEEFNFEKIYLEYISNNKRNDSELVNISEEIYQKAVDILENDEILIPFSRTEEIMDMDIDDILRMSRNIKLFTEIFLQSHGLKLNEYQNRPGLYFFKNDYKKDLLLNYYSKVIFTQNKWVNLEDVEFMCYNHPFIKEAIKNVKNSGKVSIFIIDNEKFTGKSGFLFNWSLIISNNFNMTQKLVITVFIEDNMEINRRISNYLNNLEKIDLKDYKNNNKHIEKNIINHHKQALQYAEQLAENLFWEIEKNWNIKIKKDKKKMEKYFRQKTDGIKIIKIENIRLGKLKEIKKERNEKELELYRISKLVPILKCFQIARVKFL